MWRPPFEVGDYVRYQGISIKTAGPYKVTAVADAPDKVGDWGYTIEPKAGEKNRVYNIHNAKYVVVIKGSVLMEKLLDVGN